MEYPVAAALAEAAPMLPHSKGWWYEIKFDGSREKHERTIEARHRLYGDYLACPSAA
ncbi:hypothetical protein ACFRU3_36020 [Streptomyces sp. NPDC056910]|uniref:hypothetical protein n=1 Tax=Streptomyces sp. NPDC056910 TaxID=3345964 RepID=UPI0036AD77A2